MRSRAEAQDGAFSTAYAVTFAGGGDSQLVAIGVALGLSRGIATPIVAMTELMRRLAHGDGSVVVEGLGRKDEIGAMAQAVEIFKPNAVEADRLTAAQAGEQEAKQRRARALEALIGDFDGTVAKILKAVSKAGMELGSTAQGMNTLAEQTKR
ncbi:HAMP domain-containing protein [Indioceanicola profundi]|uniref:HAMP domain-containing protein n=1 Tax=Indioceanicola profundi TaxID=2220096 RepID=UPI0013C4AB2F|nr:HAMP domain-containing protein [Indioceanicola profundi]